MSLPIPTLLLAPGRSRDRNGPVVPTLSGGVQEVDTEQGRAYRIAEETVNLATNPRLATGWHDWRRWCPTGSTITSVRTDERPDLSEWSWKTTVDVIDHSGHSFINYNTFDTTSQGPFVGSIDAVASKPMPWARIYLRMYYVEGGISDAGTTYIDLDTTPKRFTTGVATPVAGKTVDRISLFTSFGNDGRLEEGDAVWTSNLQIEEGEYATPYADGDMGQGFSWSGTPHDSTSIREAALLYSDPASLSIHEGSVAIRYKVPGTAPYQYIVSIGAIGDVTNQNLNLVRYSGESGYRLRHKGYMPVYPYPSPPDDVWSRAYIEWTPGTVGVRMNSHDLQTATRNDYTQDGAAWSQTGLAPLTSGNTSTTYDYQSNGVFTYAVAFDRPLTEEEWAHLDSLPDWEWDRFGGRTLAFAAVGT